MLEFSRWLPDFHDAFSRQPIFSFDLENEEKCTDESLFISEFISDIGKQKFQIMPPQGYFKHEMRSQVESGRCLLILNDQI